MTDVKQILEKALAKAVEDGKIPHAVVFATNADGSFTYSHATGPLHAGSADSPPITTDALFMLASQTKLLTVLSALKAVDLGLVALDEDVGSHLPELAQLKILEGFDADDKPILKERTNPITFRSLLTHSSGAVYFMGDPKLGKYNQQVHNSEYGPNPLAATVVERCGHAPLLFEPGTSFNYGPSLDWMGLLIHRLSGLPLDQFLTTHILAPLAISPNDITFFPTPAQKPAIPTLTQRAVPAGPLAPHLAPSINTFSTDPFGGHGAYARLSAYVQLLRSLLPHAPHPAPLSPALRAELFTPQLSALAAPGLAAFLHRSRNKIPGEVEAAADAVIPTQWGAGGLLFLADDAPTRRRKAGTLMWGGMCNTFWVVDPQADLAFSFATQVIPSGDAAVKEVIGTVERALYEMRGTQF